MKVNKERYAMNIYNSILKDVEKNVGNTSTYSTDLERYGKKRFGVHFKGVYASDRIPSLNTLQKFAIINADKSNEPGSHWIAIAHDPDKDITYCYDSFGRKNTQILPGLKVSGNGRIIDSDRDAEQHIMEENCGARCLAWLLFYDTYGSKASLLI